MECELQVGEMFDAFKSPKLVKYREDLGVSASNDLYIGTMFES